MMDDLLLLNKETYDKAVTRIITAMSVAFAEDPDTDPTTMAYAIHVAKKFAEVLKDELFQNDTSKEDK